ncbi:MAG: flagellar protein FlgN [Eubacteriales bacterium]|nr:flagellar protein FlgN [Eubacteriales bacterium]
MSIYADRLLSLLVKEEAVYKQLLDYSDSKRKAIVDGDTEQLDRIVSEEERLLELVSEAENDRNNLIKEISGVFNILPENVTVSKWPESLSADTADSLRKIQRDLRELLLNLDRQNQVNAKLIEVHLSYIDFLFDTATQTRETTAYSADGSLDAKKSQAANLFDETM